MQQIRDLSEAGAQARSEGDECLADNLFHKALERAFKVADSSREGGDLRQQFDALLQGARCALRCGEVESARQLIDAVGLAVGDRENSEYNLLRNDDEWPDEWLVAAIRRNPPDERLLDILAQRHWAALFARCRLMTLHREMASDLAQDSWCRVLRARETLKPGGNFFAYISKIAINLWRDRHRSALRAGPMAENRMASLDVEVTATEGYVVKLAELMPDPDSFEAEEKVRLRLDFNQALASLEPFLRDVLVARFLDGESCAAIGKRYERTEQTVSGWLRRAIEELKTSLKEPRLSTSGRPLS